MSDPLAKLRERGARARSRLEALLAIGSGAVAEPVAGLAGLGGLLTGGLDQGVRNIEGTREALTYQPRDPSSLQAIGRAVEPVMSRIEAGKQYLGDRTLEATGSPAAATAAYVAPEALASLLGLRGAGMRGPSMQQMAARSAGPYYGSPKAQIGAIMPDEYGGLHRPPLRGSGAPLDDVTGGGTVYPDDVYGPRAAQFYGHGDPALDRGTLRIVQSFRGNPDALVPVYRAVPKGEGAGKINPKDWVTVNKEYARQHGERFDGGYEILEERVRAGDLFTNGDSIHEWGWDPSK